MTLLETPVRQLVRPATDREAVPWLSVLSTAVVLSFVDGFWVNSLRGATGAIERTREPFASWLRESTVMVPVFVVAVLGAFWLALRWFGPELRRPRTVVAAGVLVAAAATVVGVAGLAASAAFDYHLQSAQAYAMGAMGHSCGGGCVVAQNHAALMLQVRAVGYGSLILAASNLLAVGWLVAVRGGRLAITASDRSRNELLERLGGAAADVAGSRLATLRGLLLVGFVGSAAIHAAVTPEHLREWPAAGLFFIGLTAAELGVAAGLLSGPDRLMPRGVERDVERAAVAVSLLPILLWGCSRTLGMPFGPQAGTPEAIGPADAIATTLEATTLLLALLLLRGTEWLRRPSTTAYPGRLTAAALVAVTAFGIAGSGLAGFDVFGVSVHQHEPTSAHAG